MNLTTGSRLRLIILSGKNEWEIDFRNSAFLLCDLPNMADRTTILLHPSAEDKPLREPFNATSLLLTEKKKKAFLVYIDTQCRFMEGPIVRQ